MLKIFPDLESLSQAAAELFAEQAYLAVKTQENFYVALSGGTTPRRTYELLAQEPLRSSVPWPHCQVFWGDERYVQAKDARSNHLLARMALLNQVPIPETGLHPIVCAQSPAQTAENYERQLRRIFPALPSFDFVFLGVGSDGHIASLFPGTPASREQRRWVCATQKPGEPDLFRITLTLPVINNAKVIVFLVSGTDKAKLLRTVFATSEVPTFPVQFVQPIQGKVYWFLDQAAASQL